MIKKILARDYVKGWCDMTADERGAFVGRVGEWLSQDGVRLLSMTDRPLARSQSLFTISMRWTSEECHAMAEGIYLMSAFVDVAETWLPTQIYMKSAYRAVRQVVAVLSEVKSKDFFAEQSGKAERRVKNSLHPVGSKTLPSSVGAKASPGSKRQGGDAIAGQLTKKRSAGMGGQTKHVPAGKPQGTVVPARPKHIDQYVHLLPKATQERAAEYGELMRRLGEARENLQLLIDDEQAPARIREQWAKRATKTDEYIGRLNRELDREWEKVVQSGRVVVDDLGLAHLLSEEGIVKSEALELCSLATEGRQEFATVTQEPVGLTSEQKKRRRELRKWLIDLRRGKEGKDREKRIELWKQNWKEYLTLEPKEKALEDEKILEAAKHFGIDLEVKSEE